MRLFAATATDGACAGHALSDSNQDQRSGLRDFMETFAEDQINWRRGTSKWVEGDPAGVGVGAAELHAKIVTAGVQHMQCVQVSRRQ